MDENFPDSKTSGCSLWQANVVKGLKLYEDVFTGTQLSKLLEYVNQLRDAGRNQQLPGDFIGPPAIRPFTLCFFINLLQIQGRHLLCSTRTPKEPKESLFSLEFQFSGTPPMNTQVIKTKDLVVHPFSKTLNIYMLDGSPKNS